MERIFITPKQDNSQPTEAQPDEDVVPTESYSEALNHFLKWDERPPRSLTGADVLRPSEFHDFFRPKLNNDEDGSLNSTATTAMDASEVSDDRMESSLSEVGDGAEEDDGEGSTELMFPIKIEKIKEEKS